MKLFRSVMLALAVSCLAAALVAAQSGRKRNDAPGPGRGGGQGAEEQGGGGGTPSGPDARGVYTTRQVTRRAVIKSRPEPDFPPEARRQNVQGVVRLKIIFRADGSVDDHIEVQKSLPYGVTEAAIRAAKRIEFEPAERDGRKVSQYATLEYNFNLY